jgi:hypothetical protein
MNYELWIIIINTCIVCGLFWVPYCNFNFSYNILFCVLNVPFVFSNMMVAFVWTLPKVAGQAMILRIFKKNKIFMVLYLYVSCYVLFIALIIILLSCIKWVINWYKWVISRYKCVIVGYKEGNYFANYTLFWNLLFVILWLVGYCIRRVF